MSSGSRSLVMAAARFAGLPFRVLVRGGFQPPEKALILKPCCLSQAMLATPLLAALAETYPRAQFDWAVGSHARPAVATNRRLSELIDCGPVGLPGATWNDMRELAQRLAEQQYDTCFIPSGSAQLALVAWLARIPQRVGLLPGFAHTIAVKPPAGRQNAALRYLALARALGIEAETRMEFYPSDKARAAVTKLLIDEIDWLGERPLALLHPGGGTNPARQDETKRWPVERFALLGNHLTRKHEARVVLVGGAADRAAAAAVTGMISADIVNLAGSVNLDVLAALCEVADLYVGNDAGSTHVAVAAGCPTLAIYGPNDPVLSAPYAPDGRVAVLYDEVDGEFSWDEVVSPEAAIAAADQLLARDDSN